jgi:uncharacterized protein (TIGR02246 family)
VKLLPSLAVALLLLALFAPGVVQAQATDPVAVKNAFDAALNAGDVERALATFAPDARFTTPGGNVLTGSQQIRAYLQELVAQNYRADVLETRLTGPETVFSRATIGLDQFRRLGLASVEATAEVVVRGGRITSFTSALTPAAAARLQAAQTAAATGVRLPQTGQASTPLGMAWGVPWLVLGLALTFVLAPSLVVVRARRRR